MGAAALSGTVGEADWFGKYNIVNGRLTLLERRDELRSARISADEVIGHDNVHDVLCAPLRHMTRHTIGVGWHCLFVQCGRVLMATDTNGLIMRGSFFFRHFAMRVVARYALEPSLAFTKTVALFQSVWMVIDLEAILFRDGAVDNVELNEVFAQRLAGTK